MISTILKKGAILGGLGVLLGAFGAHALKNILTSEQLTSFNTGVRYQLIHAILLLFMYLLIEKNPNSFFKNSAKFIFWGVILFSGSIYILTIKNLTEIEILKLVGPITPIGGLLLIIGWIQLLIGAIQLKK